jgi:CcmD family protein
MSGMGYLAVGYGAIWLLLAVYLLWLGRRQMVLRRRLDELEDHLPGSDE